MGTILEDALKHWAYHLAKNVEDLTPGQIAQVEANPQKYLPEGYIPEEETPEEEIAEAGEGVPEEVAETQKEVPEPPAEPVPEPPAEAVVRKTRKRG